MQLSSNILKLTLQNPKLTHITSEFENKARDPKNFIKPNKEFAFDEDSTSIGVKIKPNHLVIAEC